LTDEEDEQFISKILGLLNAETRNEFGYQMLFFDWDYLDKIINLVNEFNVSPRYHKDTYDSDVRMGLDGLHFNQTREDGDTWPGFYTTERKNFVLNSVRSIMKHIQNFTEKDYQELLERRTRKIKYEHRRGIEDDGEIRKFGGEMVKASTFDEIQKVLEQDEFFTLLRDYIQPESVETEGRLGSAFLKSVDIEWSE